MKNIILLCLLTALCSTAQEQKSNVSIPDQPGYIQGQLIYPLDNKPTPQCHASTIEETSSGALIASWFGGTHERNKDVCIWTSRYSDGKWDAPVQAADGIQSPSLRYPCWNPVLFQPASGPLMLFYKIGPGPKGWWGMLMTSIDDGKTWSEPRRLGTDPAIGNLLGPVKNKPIQLPDGSILCPSSIERNSWQLCFELTRDLGKTWEVIGPLSDPEEFNAIQPTLLTYPGGRIQALSRSQKNIITQNWSEDGGKTWSVMAATSLRNPNSGIDAVTLADGRQLLVYNDTETGRYPINLAVSSDGKTWNNVLLLEHIRGEFSYPAIIQTSDGLVHITYTYLRQAIKHVIVDPALFQKQKTEKAEPL